MMKDIKMR